MAHGASGLCVAVSKHQTASFLAQPLKSCRCTALSIKKSMFFICLQLPAGLFHKVIPSVCLSFFRVCRKPYKVNTHSSALERTPTFAFYAPAEFLWFGLKLTLGDDSPPFYRRNVLSLSELPARVNKSKERLFKLE